MANDLAIELQPEGVTMVSLWPGLVGTENVRDGALSGGRHLPYIIIDTYPTS